MSGHVPEQELPKERRFRLQARAILAFALMWVMLWGQASLINILVGLVVGWLVTVVFPLPSIVYWGRPHPWAMLKLTWFTLADLVVSSFQIAMRAFRPRLDLRPGMVRVDLHATSDMYQVITAELVSIVPGTIVVEARRSSRRLYLHVFDLPDEAAIEKARSHALLVERHVVEAFGSPTEIKRLKEWRP